MNNKLATCANGSWVSYTENKGAVAMSRTSQASSWRPGNLIQTRVHTTQTTRPPQSNSVVATAAFLLLLPHLENDTRSLSSLACLGRASSGTGGPCRGSASGAPGAQRLAACGPGGCHLECVKCSSRHCHPNFIALRRPRWELCALFLLCHSGLRCDVEASRIAQLEED